VIRWHGWTPPKREAIKQVIESGHPVADVAKRLGVSSKSIYTRPRELGGRSRASKQVENAEVLQVENIRLKAELKRTQEERDILKKPRHTWRKHPSGVCL
jgi:transposase